MMQSIILCDHVTERDVIGLRNLVTEREVPPPNLPLKGEEKEHREIIIKMRNSYILKLLL